MFNEKGRGRYARKAFGVVLAGGMFLPGVVFAEEAGATAPVEEEPSTAVEDSTAESMELIVVTAARVEQDIKEVPASVSVIDLKELDTVKFVDSRRELLKRIPGYSMVRNLRIPIGSKNYTINLIDGLAISAPFGSGTISSLEDTNTMDIERVEVVRGPASALYGSNALGGVINVITREPPLEPEYRTWGEVGEYDRWRGGVSAAGSNDLFGYFADANLLDSEGWQDRTANRRKQLSTKLVFDPSVDSSLSIRGEYLDSYLENPGSLSQNEYESNWRQAAIDDAYNDVQSVSLSAKYERDLNSHSGFELSYGIRSIKEEGPPSYSASGNFISSDTAVHNLVGIWRQSFDTLDGQLVGGVDLQHSSDDATSYAGRSASDPISKRLDIKAVVTSPFAQYEFSPLDNTRVSLGARYDRVRYSAAGYKVGRTSTTPYDESVTFSRLSPKAGVVFDLGGDQTLWFGYGQGFVVPSSTYLFIGSGYGSNTYDPNPDLNPELAENFEMGLRGLALDSRLNYDITAFRTDIDDMLVGDTISDVYVNAGKVRIEGLESTIGYRINRGWRFDLTHTLARNRFIDFESEGADYSGNTMSASPRHHFNARLTWMPIPGLSSELEWNHISDYHTSDTNDDPQGLGSRPDLLNLRVSYRSGDMTLWGHVLNLLNKKYAERISYDSDDDERSFEAGSPRAVYVGLSYMFH